MFLQSYAPQELTPSRVLDALTTQQEVVIWNGIDPSLAREAHAVFAELMRDQKKLRAYPFDPQTRLGYTPPGIETLQRGSKNPDWNRSMFDFNPELTFNEPAIAELYEAAVAACRLVLRHLDQAQGTDVATFPEGKHTLRTAQYLREGKTADDVLFPRHRDFSLLTAFVGFDMPGLESEVDGVWHPAELAYGDVLIGIGTPLTQLHPGLQPLWHRIVGGADYRLSSFLFFDLHEDFVLPKTQERYGAMLARVLKSIRADI